MTPNDRTRVPQEVVARRVGEEVVMMHLVKGTYYSLDPVGARIWQLLAEGKPIGDVSGILAQEYDASRDDLDRDVVDLVDELSRSGLVVPV